ncbi:UNVERIFIED_CONTAM: Ubiquitin-protein ligase E3B [Siphonaria sp. JEL0065]|nr:Ubiquitin-protein ligase E3B [Siphonaria sp. JEL0065]
MKNLRQTAAAETIQRWWRRRITDRHGKVAAGIEFDSLVAKEGDLRVLKRLLHRGRVATGDRVAAVARKVVASSTSTSNNCSLNNQQLEQQELNDDAFLAAQCWKAVQAEEYTSGPELRLLILHNSLGPDASAAAALAAKTKARARLLKHAVQNAKAIKSNVLCINALLMLLLNANDHVAFTAFVLSVPLLVSMLDKSGLQLLLSKNTLSNSLRVLNSDNNFSSGALDFIGGELSIFLLGNILLLLKLDVEMKKSLDSNSSGSIPAILPNFISAATRLLKTCGQHVKSKSSNMTRFHPVLQWYSGPLLDIPNEFHIQLADTLSFLWSRPFIKIVFADLLAFGFPPPATNKQSKRNKFFSKLGFKEDGSSVDERQVTLLSVSTLEICNFYYNLGRIMLNSTTQIYTSLSWTPTLIPRLWRLINVVGPQGFATSGTQLFLRAAKNPSKEPLMPILNTFAESCCILFMTLDDDDIYERQLPFILEELALLSSFLNVFCFNAIWNAESSSLVVNAEVNAFDSSTLDVSQRLLGILYDQSTRRPFGGEDKDDWIMKEVKRGTIVEDVKRGDPRAIAILNHMPQCIPFAHRVDIFRHMVKSDKKAIGEAPMMITVRRQAVLEDGFRQLGKITLSQLKQTIKVRFVNEHGLVEAGIDQNGVFKEFLEDMCKRAFAADFGLFRTTDDGNCVPSMSSSIHDDHLQLLAFVGRIFGKALYEGIVIDIPFATFVYAKMLGRLNFFEDLPSLDTQLYKNLLFLKHYEGDASDLGLSFTIDESMFGKIVTKEIKPGGAGIMVANENKYEYIHIMSDYRLNQECKAQFKALVGGFRAVMPERYIRFFSPRELQTLMSGENVDFDVSDLRKHTCYEGGYFDGHVTIRSLWQVVEEMSPKEKNAFLKFVTSCSNPPVGGFRHLDPPFTIRFVAAISSDDADTSPAAQFGKAIGSFFGVGKDATRLPTASTCFNVLKLPAYQKKSSLKAKLLYAIKSGAGFDLS